MMATQNFENLFIALINCFLMILFGYIFGRFQVITPNQALGISKFVGYFALPTLLFKNMVELKFDTVNWLLILAIFLAKTIVFFVVFFMTLLMNRGKGFNRAGIYAIFSTQSNDFAMGYPIIQVLYADTHPELVQYIYLLAPIQLVILNPLGFMFLESSKQLSNERHVLNDGYVEESEGLLSNEQSDQDRNTQHQQDTTPTRQKWDILRNVAKGLCLNPVVIMVFVGLIFHFIFKGTLPTFLASIVNTPSEAFSASALFYLGLSMVGKIHNVKGPSMFISAGLVLAKILLLPIISRGIMLLLAKNVTGLSTTNPNSTSDGNVLADFAYLYGTIPTAPSVIIFATQYNIEIDRMATSMVACTALSAPMMYVSAWSLTYSSVNADYFMTLIHNTYADVSYVGIVCSVWCIFIFLASKKFKRIPHMVTFALTCSMLWMSIMTAVSVLVVEPNTSTSIVMTVFGFTYFGIATTRFLTASLAVSLLLLELRGTEVVKKFMFYLIMVPVLLGFFWALVTSLTGSSASVVPLNVSVGKSSMVTRAMSIIMLVSPLSLTVACLVFLFRRATLRMDEEVNEALDTINERHPNGSDSSLLFEDEDDITLIDVREDLAGSDQISKDHQFTRHVCLLVFLMVSMLIGTVLITWQINGSSMTGSYTELSFLDSFFSVGQALFVFFIFGFDNELIIEPISKLYRQVFGKSGELDLPLLHELGSDDLKTCGLFVKYHLKKCKKSIQKVYRRTLHSQERGFTGISLVSWLVHTNIVSNRHEAVIFGEQLLRGRVIKHVNEQYHFHDQSYYYQFNSPDVSTASSPSISNNKSNDQNLMFGFEVYLKSNSRNFVMKTEAKSEDEDMSSVVRDCASDIVDIFNQSSSNEASTSR